MFDEEERWAIIEDCPFYLVSSYGNVRRFIRGSAMNKRKININLRQQLHNDYLIVKLQFNKKQMTFGVHRLVAKAFVANPHDKEEVNHKDLDKCNNYYKNLEWNTPKENTNHAIDNGHYRHRPILCFDIYGNFVTEYENAIIASSALKLTKDAIRSAIRRDQICGRKFKFQYKNV